MVWDEGEGVVMGVSVGVGDSVTVEVGVSVSSFGGMISTWVWEW